MSQDLSHHRLQIIIPKIVVTGYSTRTEIFQNWDGSMILSRGSRRASQTFMYTYVRVITRLLVITTRTVCMQ
jgi:hypothetical protein